MIDIGDDLALVDRDVRTRDVVAVLIADEHGFFARIASAATACPLIKLYKVSIRRIIDAAECDVIVRRTHTRDNGV